MYIWWVQNSEKKYGRVGPPALGGGSLGLGLRLRKFWGTHLGSQHRRCRPSELARGFGSWLRLSTGTVFLVRGTLGGQVRLGAVVTAAVGVASVSSGWSALREPRPLGLGDSLLGGEPGLSARFLLRARRSGVELLGPAGGPLVGFRSQSVRLDWGGDGRPLPGSLVVRRIRALLFISSFRG